MSTNLYVLLFFSPFLILFFSFFFWIYREEKRRGEQRRKWDKEWKEELWEIKQEELREIRGETMKTSRLICSTSNQVDPMKMIEFQEEYCNLLKLGVPPQEIVRNWNDSQDSFWNKVYLVEESK